MDVQTSDNPIANKDEIESLIKRLLDLVGEDSSRQGLLQTPHRVAKMFDELLRGYFKDVNTIVNEALYDVDDNTRSMVIVEAIPYNSLCEHHMLPFSGKAYIAYLPNKKIIGLSKIPRIVDMFSQRLQVQERLTVQVADTLEKVLEPLGVAIIVTGVHSCAALRGVKKTGVVMKTMEYRGDFKNNQSLRMEFLQTINLE